MNKFKLKVSDFESYLNNLGYTMGSVKSDGKYIPLTDEILNCGSSFHIQLFSQIAELAYITIHPNIIYINYKNSFGKVDDLTSKWRSHLYRVRGQEYYDYLKDYFDRYKSFCTSLHNKYINEIDMQIKELEAKKQNIIDKNNNITNNLDNILIQIKKENGENINSNNKDELTI